ncbi:Geraniol 8-hydroxylase [Bertholletia excelsa]
MPSGDKSRLIRRALSTFLLHPKKLDTLVGLRHKTMQELVQHVTKMSETGEAVDIGKLAFITALNQMSNTCFSMNVADYNSGEAQGFLNAVKTVMFVVGQFNIADVFPWLKPLDPQGLKRRAKVAYNWLNSVSNEFVTKRLQHRKLNIARHGDMLDSLLDYVQEELELNYECVKVLLVELLLGGTETSSITTEWVMTELILNPNIMATVREEIQKKVGDKERIEESDVLELPSLQAVIKETMRLHLTVPLLVPHKTETEVELNGYVIPKNTQTIVNAWAIARDPKYWEEPTVFKPERFLNSKLDFKGQHFSFIPFGSGRRMCPGIPLAHRVVSLMVASLVYHFDWNLPHGLTPEKLDMNDIFGLTLQRAIPLMAVPTICQK